MCLNPHGLDWFKIPTWHKGKMDVYVDMPFLTHNSDCFLVCLF